MSFDRRIIGNQAVSGEVEVQQTTFSLDVVGRYFCNTLPEAVNDAGLAFDMVVLWAGMFGAYCTEKIYRRGAANKRVLILEAGDFLSASPFRTWLAWGSMLRTQSAAIRAPRASGFGARHGEAIKLCRG